MILKNLIKKSVPLTLAACMAFSCLQLNVSASDNKITGMSAKGVSVNGHEASYVVDGDYNTYWETPTPYQSVNSYMRYIDIDLKGLYDVSKVNVFTDTDKYYQYSIYASTDGVTYDKVAYKANQDLGRANGEEYVIGSKEARYIRVSINYMSGTQRKTNMKEVEVYGSLISSDPVTSTQIETDDFNDSAWGDEYKRFESDKAYADQKVIDETYNLVGRIIGDQWKDAFVFELRPNSVDDHDIFEVESKDGKIVIRGNDGVSLASGFNYYLKYYCKIDYNPNFSSNLEMPSELPMLDESMTKETLYDLRYALNFCTYSYTMSFWNWDEYEAFIDWAAMNGINLMLDIIGQEEVQRRMLREYGYTDEEIKNYITGPAYFAWFYMQNMTSYGGPLPNNWFADRVELGRRMHDRMQTFGITPVMEGFAGMVPSDFGTKNPKSKVIPSGGWSGYVRPATVQTFLLDKDIANGKEDYFAKVADTFYKVQKDVFGDVSNYYAVDPFHEGGSFGDLNPNTQMSQIYETMQNRMIENDEKAVWVLQKWGTNASVTQLKNLKKDHIVVLDLFSEQSDGSSNMENTGTPWIWNMLHNFGGRMGMFGNPELLANKIPTDMKKHNNMVGIGMTPEAWNTSPMLWELLFDMTWEQDPINYREWVNNYIERRYGKTNEDVEAAWEILLDTVYQNKIPDTQGAAESVVNWKPSMDKFTAASTYGHSSTLYDNEEFEKAVQYLIKAYPEFKDSATFKYDFIDVLAQVISNSGKKLQAAMASAYTNKNLDEFDRLSEHFLTMIEVQDKILSTNKEYDVGTWINRSRKMVNDADDWTNDLFELNARSLITIWGSANNDSLLDYSNRQWSGLTSDVYLLRWKTALKEFRQRIISGNVSNKNINSNDYWMMSWEWANKKSDEGDNGYSGEPTDYDLAELAEHVYDDYSLANLKTFLQSGVDSAKPNVALGKAVTSNKSTTSDFPLKNLTDGNQQTDWTQGSVEWPTELVVDLGGNYDIDGMTFKLPQVADDFIIGYEVYVYHDGAWSSQPVAKEEPKALGGTVNIDYFGSGSKVKYVFSAAENTVTKAPSFAELEVFGTESTSNNNRNVALNKTVTADGFTCSNANLATDGNQGTIAAGATSTNKGSFIVDLGETYEVEQINVLMEAGKPFGFKFITYAQLADDSWIIIDDQSDNKLTNSEKDRYSTVVEGQLIKKVKVEYLGKIDGTQMWPGVGEIEVMAKQKVTKVENVALHKSVSLSDGLSSGNTTRVTDGDRNSLYGSANSVKTGTITVDLGDVYNAQTINVVMEAGNPFGFKFKTNVQLEDDSWVTVEDQSGNTLSNAQKNIFITNINGKKIKKVQVEYLGKTDGTTMWPGICELEVVAEVNDEEEEEVVSAPKQNVAYKAPAAVSKEGRPAKNLTDNDLDSIWTSGDASYPATAKIDLGAEMQIDFTRVYFEVNKDSPTGRAFKYYVRGYNSNNELVFVDDQTGTTAKHIYHDTAVDKKIRYVEVELVGKLSTEGAWPAIAEIQAFSPLVNAMDSAAVTPIDGIDASKVIDNDDTSGVLLENKNTTFEFTLDKAKDIYAVELIKGTSTEALHYKVEIQEPNTDKYRLFIDGSKNLDNANKLVISKDKALTNKVRVTILNEGINVNEIRLYTYQALPELLAYISDIESKVNGKTIGDLSGNYTQVSKDTFTNAIIEIKKQIAEAGTMNSEEVLPLKYLVKNLYTAFLSHGFVSINRSPVISALEEANALKQYVIENDKEYVLTEAFNTAFNEAMTAKSANISQANINVAAITLRSLTAEIIVKLSDIDQYTINLALAKETLKNAVIGGSVGNVSQAVYDELKEAIEAAEQAFVENPAQAKQLADSLNEAITRFNDHKVVENANWVKTILKGAIDKAQFAVDSGVVDILAPSVAALINARLAEANAVYANADATEQGCLRAWLNLADALHYMDFVADKSDLEKLINECKKIDVTDYVSGVEVFKAALKHAEEVYANEDVLQATINSTYKALFDARNGLSKENQSDLAMLQKLIEMVNAVVGDGADYRQDANWNTFVKALADAKSTVINVEASKEEIQIAITALTSAYENLRFIPDENKLANLKAFIEAFDALDASLYSGDDFQQMKAIADQARAVLEDFDNQAYDVLSPKLSSAWELMETGKMETSKPTEDAAKDPADNTLNNTEQTTTQEEGKQTHNASSKPATGDATAMSTLAMLALGAGAILISNKKRKHK